MIKHIICDIFESGADAICHQVNCQGVMGSGIAKQVKDKYPLVFDLYKNKCKLHSAEELLGQSQFVETIMHYDTPFYGIFNLFAQDKFGYDGKCYTDYEALRKSLEDVNNHFRKGKGAVVAIPYLMSCHRGGGNWDVVYKIIEETLTNCDVLICEYNKN